MTFKHGIKTGLKSYSNALSFIFTQRLYWFFIFPVLFNIILFAAGYHTTASLSEEAINSLNEWIGMAEWSFWGASFIADLTKGLIWFTLRLSFFLLYAYIGGYLILIILSPVFAYLSEITEKKLTGQNIPFNFIQFIKDIGRGITLALRNLTIELLLTFLLFVASFIPVAGYFTTPVLLMISSYFYGFSFMDYSMERKQMKVHESINFVRTHRGMAIGNGIVFSLTLMIPYIGITLAGFLSIISVVAATLAIQQITAEK
ncbi:hypothetical protein DMA11_00680 [Marinilabiliaceae bacterium JC017]|nr:hypothetical protein DMA11_00680 [Marinilabiliaceae bacterium JC017]